MLTTGGKHCSRFNLNDFTPKIDLFMRFLKNLEKLLIGQFEFFVKNHARLGNNALGTLLAQLNAPDFSVQSLQTCEERLMGVSQLRSTCGTWIKPLFC